MRILSVTSRVTFLNKNINKKKNNEVMLKSEEIAAVTPGEKAPDHIQEAIKRYKDEAEKRHAEWPKIITRPQKYQKEADKVDGK